MYLSFLLLQYMKNVAFFERQSIIIFKPMVLKLCSATLVALCSQGSYFTALHPSFPYLENGD